MRILYVEDDPNDADLTVRALRKSAPHFRVETVSAVGEALDRLELIAREPLDLVLTDMHLRDGDGLSLLHHIRENGLPVAVVLITGMGDEETAVAALKARADDYVMKRKDYLDRLPVVLESALNHHHADAARRAHPLNILYAEDDLRDADNTRRHLAVHADHLHLDTVSNGLDALSALRPEAGGPRYAVFLLSLDLQEPYALEVLWELLLKQWHDVPVVLLCHERDEDLARRALNLGASSFLVKRPGYLYQLPWELEDAYSRADLMRREAALRASEARNHAILNAIPDLMFLQSRDGTYLDYHAKDTDLLLLPPEHFLGKNVKDVMPPELAAEFMLCFEQALASEKPVVLEYTLPVPDGVRVYEASIVGCDGDKILSIVRDITERKRAEEAIRQRDHLLRTMFNSLSSQVAVLDREGVITYMSRSWEEFAERNQGRPEAVGIGVNYLGVCRAAAADDPTAREALEGIGAVLAGEQPTFSIEYPCHSPTEQRWFLMHVDLMPPEHGGVVITHTNITERRLAAEALKSALEEVRQLKDRLQEENIYLQEEVRVASDFGEIIGRSAALSRVLRKVEKVAPAETAVLILGETGTGKELLARAIHRLSPRSRHPLVKVNCAALPAQLIESELFGHEKGAFTGATAQRRGRFELADGGTIFLDEVGELPLDLQAKLLRALEQGEFERVGGSRTLTVNVRLIAATNRNLAVAVQKSTFRSDLYYRLDVYPVTLPPLRERREDIPMLVKHFVRQLSTKMGKVIETIPQQAMTALQTYAWPGNIRELRNMIERAVIITQGTTLRLPDDMGSPSSGAGAPAPGTAFDSQPAQYSATETLEQSEHNLILRTLKRLNWKIEGPGGAAELLDINPNTLRTRMKKLGISRP